MFRPRVCPCAVCGSPPRSPPSQTPAGTGLRMGSSVGAGRWTRAWGCVHQRAGARAWHGARRAGGAPGTAGQFLRSVRFGAGRSWEWPGLSGAMARAAGTGRVSVRVRCPRMGPRAAVPGRCLAPPSQRHAVPGPSGRGRGVGSAGGGQPGPPLAGHARLGGLGDGELSKQTPPRSRCVLVLRKHFLLKMPQYSDSVQMF